MQYLIHLKDCLNRLVPDTQQNLAQSREVVEKMRALVPEGTLFVGDQIFSNLNLDSDHIIDELMRLKTMTDDLVHEVIFPRIPRFLMFPSAWEKKVLT